MTISAIILAGGLGTRLKNTVPDLPKPMAPINGRPFLEYLLDYWITQGVENFVMSVGYRHQQIVSHFGNRYKKANLQYAIEDTPLGTGGGLCLAITKLPVLEPFLLLNGDTYFRVDLNKLMRFAAINNSDWCFSLFRTNEQGRYMGISTSSNGKITSLKAGVEDANRLVNGGVYWVDPRRLEFKLPTLAQVSLEDDIFAAALASNQVLIGLESSGIFIDIGVPVDYQRAGELITLFE